MAEKEFRVNKHLVLKLEEGKTNIYVGGRLFLHCKRLLLNQVIGESVIDYQEQIKDILYDIANTSIDEQSERLNYGNLDEPEEIFFDTDEEFWAHCSNLQAWTENNYDTRLLHSNLAFSLLKKLTEEGDLIANRMYKEEIAKRFEHGSINVKLFLFENEWISCLDTDISSRLKKEMFLQVINTCSLEKKRELRGEGFLYDISTNEVIDGCLVQKEAELLYEIIERGESHGIRYDWIIDMHSEEWRERWYENGDLRFFQIYEGHVIRLELDLIYEPSDILSKLSNFKELNSLYLYFHNNKLQDYKNTVLKSVETLDLRSFSQMELDFEEILKIFPNIRHITLNPKIIFINLKYLKKLKNLKYVSAPKIYIKENLQVDLKKKGIKILEF